MSEPELVNPCSVCEEAEGFNEWELTDGESYCYDCVSEKYKDRPVPQEWIIEEE